MENTKQAKKQLIKHPEDVKYVAQNFRVKPKNVLKNNEETIFSAEDEHSGRPIEVRLAQYTILRPRYNEILEHSSLFTYFNDRFACYNRLFNQPCANQDESLYPRNQACIIGDMLKQLGSRTNTTEIFNLITHYRDRMPEFVANGTNLIYPQEDEEDWKLNLASSVSWENLLSIPELLEGFHVHRSLKEEARELESW